MFIVVLHENKFCTVCIKSTLSFMCFILCGHYSIGVVVKLKINRYLNMFYINHLQELVFFALQYNCFPVSCVLSDKWLICHGHWKYLSITSVIDKMLCFIFILCILFQASTFTMRCAIIFLLLLCMHAHDNDCHL